MFTAGNKRRPARYPEALTLKPTFLLGTLCALGATPALAGPSAGTPCPLETVVRVGLVSFKGMPNEAGTLEGFLQAAATQSKDNPVFRCPVTFAVVAGNYYQILAWLKSEQIDAAVVSPFMFSLLREEGTILSTPLLELAEWGGGREYHLPTLRLEPRPGADPAPALPADPAIELDRLLCGTLRAAERPGQSDVPSAAPCASSRAGAPTVTPVDPDLYELDMVSHLSTSGLVVPFLHAKQWLALQNVTDGNIVKAFWDRLRTLIRFRFSHDAHLERGSRKLFAFSFDYGDGKDKNETVYAGEVKVPNDVLVIRGGEIARLFTPSFDPRRVRAAAAVKGEGPGVPCQGGAPPDAHGPFTLGCLPELQVAARRPTSGAAPAQEGYAEALAVSPLQEEFAGDVSKLFDSGSLQDLWREWYEERQFTFTVDETLDFLRKDQAISNLESLALVLPGGGVKATYQAVLLDHLYQSSSLVNALAKDPPARPGAPGQPDGASAPLKVKAVIGTSGGALMGLFTALLDTSTRDLSDSSQNLTGLWIRGNQVRTKDSHVFSWLSVPRYLTFWLILAIVALVFFAAGRLQPDSAATPAASAPGEHAKIVDNRIGLHASTVLLTVVFSTPWLVKKAIDVGARGTPAIREYLPVVEGLLYTALLLATHYIWTCGDARPLPKRRILLRLFAFAAGIAVTGWSLTAGARHETTLTIPGLGWQVWLPSFGVVLGALIVVGGILFEGLASRGGFSLTGSRHYAGGMAALAGIFVTALSLFGIGVSCHAYTYLELTGAYWLYIGLAGVSAGLLALLAQFLAARVVARRGLDVRAGRVAAAIQRSIAYLRVDQPFMRLFRSSPIWTLTFVDVAGLALWLGLVAPALYSNAKAVAFLRTQVDESGYRSAALELKSTLIVTTTNLTRVAADRSLLPPDYYFCFGPSCRPIGVRQFSPRFDSTISLDDIIDPVFASGSPFPIFPGHFVKKGLLSLIDGGFAHNTPIEAAGYVQCRQILLINSSSAADNPRQLQRDAEHHHYTSELVRNLERLPGFLFDRSQETDRAAGRGFVVMALTPEDDGMDPPFLADFRPDTVRRIEANALHDLQHERIGSIVSVGVPGPPLLQIRAADPLAMRAKARPGRR